MARKIIIETLKGKLHFDSDENYSVKPDEKEPESTALISIINKAMDGYDEKNVKVTIHIEVEELTS